MKKQVILLSSSIGLLACCSPAYAQFIPGGVDSAGLSYLVPDMLVWYNTNQLPGNFFPGYVTNGPIYNLNDQFGNTEVGNANWDAKRERTGRRHIPGHVPHDGRRWQLELFYQRRVQGGAGAWL